MLIIVLQRTTISLEGNTMLCTRFIANRIYKVVMEIDGTTKDYTTKCNRIAMVDDELFVIFDGIRRDSGELIDCLESV